MRPAERETSPTMRVPFGPGGGLGAGIGRRAQERLSYLRSATPRNHMDGNNGSWPEVFNDDGSGRREPQGPMRGAGAGRLVEPNRDAFGGPPNTWRLAPGPVGYEADRFLRDLAAYQARRVV